MSVQADGTFSAGGTIYLKWTTRTTTGAPTTLSGTPVVSIYKDNSTTESVAGVTLTADFDSRTGLNHLTIDTSADSTFYANGHQYWAVITTGTVGGVSVVGEVVASFVLNNNVWDEVLTGATHNIQNSAGKDLRLLIAGTTDVIFSGAVQSSTNVTNATLVLPNSASSADGAYATDVFSITAGTGQGSLICTSYVGSTRTATFGGQTWSVAPILNDTVEITPSGSSKVVGYFSGQDPASSVLNATAASFNTAGSIGADINKLDATISSRSTYSGGAVASVTGNVGGNVVGSVASVTGNVGGSVASVTGAVGSVTAAVSVDYTQVVTEAYSAKGGTATHANLLHEINQRLQNMGISSTTMTVKKRDNSSAMTFTLDSATNPTSITRAT